MIQNSSFIQFLRENVNIAHKIPTPGGICGRAWGLSYPLNHPKPKKARPGPGAFRFPFVGKAVPGRSDFKIFPKQKKLEKVLASFSKSIHCVRRFDRICLFYIHYVE